MTKTLEDYARQFRDNPRNLNALKQFPLPEGGGAACGKGDEPNTTIAFIVNRTGGGVMAVENGDGIQATEVPATSRSQADIDAIGRNAITFCHKFVP